MTEIKQFNSLNEYTDFILNSPQEEVEKYLRETMGEEAFNKYMQDLREYEDTLIHGTGTLQPTGILNFKDGVK
jgi:hypothetical protein